MGCEAEAHRKKSTEFGTYCTSSEDAFADMSDLPELLNYVAEGDNNATTGLTSPLPAFNDVVAMFHLDLSFPAVLKDLYITDTFFADIIEKVKSFHKFMLADGLLFFVEEDGCKFCVPSEEASSVNVHECVISHAHSLLAYLGGKKIFYYLQDHIWWPCMFQDIKEYYVTCHTCAMANPRAHNAYGLLKPFPIPLWQWQQIGINFIGLLPSSSNRHRV